MDHGKKDNGKKTFHEITLFGVGGLFALPSIDLKQETKVVGCEGKRAEICLSYPWKDWIETPGHQHGGHEFG